MGLFDYKPELAYFGLTTTSPLKPTRFVCNDATTPYVRGSTFIADNLSNTISGALGFCTAGLGDVIVVLPGHSETVGSDFFDGLKEGVTIWGWGNVMANDAPTLTWTATGATMTIDQANVTLANLNLAVSTAAITKAIAVTKKGFLLHGCRVKCGTSGTVNFEIGVDFGTGSGDGTIAECKFTSSADSDCQCIDVSAAVDNIRIRDCHIDVGGDATATGVIDVAAAATNLEIANCYVKNSIASSTAAISIGDVAATGVVRNCTAGITTATAAAAAAAITQGASGDVAITECYGIGEYAQHSGILTPVVTDGT